jgi:hypothetical protein
MGRPRSRRGVTPRAVLGLSAALASALLAGCSHASAPLDTTVQKRLLSIADADAKSCSGPATHVQTVHSTRATANKIATGAVVNDNRAVWVLLITGGPFTCQHTGPAGASLAPASDQIIVLDASTFEPTDGGFGDHDTLAGLGPVSTLR